MIEYCTVINKIKIGKDTALPASIAPSTKLVYSNFIDDIAPKASVDIHRIAERNMQQHQENLKTLIYA